MLHRAAIVMAFALGLLLSSCGGGGSGGDAVIRVGVIAELTGDLAAAGASCRNAAELAARRINESGGVTIAGRPHTIKVFVEDNAGKAEQSVSAAQKLIAQDRVVAIIGPNASRYAIPASEIAEANRTVLISPWSTNPKLTLDARTNAPKRYVFRSCFIDPFQGGLLARFALDNLQARRAAVLYDVASEYNKGIAEVFKAAFESGGGLVAAFETYTTGDKDFSAQITKIANAGPDVLFLPNYYSEVPLQIQQAQRLGLSKVPILGSDSWGSSELLKLCAGACEGYYFSTHYAADTATPQVAEFIRVYHAAFGVDPDDVAALTTDAFGLIIDALSAAGSADREAIRNALAEIQNYEGITGTMRFSGTGDPVKSAVIIRIQDGAFRFHTRIEP